jgi:ABC-type transport system, involved in lipoprotein release, permease component
MFIALLAIVIGATVFMGMMTVYLDIPRQMGNEFRSYGANLIIVPSGGESMTNAQADKAESHLRGVSVVGTARYRYEAAKINGQPIMTAGINFADVKRVSSYWSVSGGYPAAEKEMLVGRNVASLLQVITGDSITLEGIRADGGGFSQNFTVAGIVSTGGNEESLVFIDITELEHLMGNGDVVNVIECSVSASADALNSIVSKIKSDNTDVSAYLVKQLTNSESAVMNKLTSLIFLVMTVALLLTMVCVSTTMTTVVAERRKEIGLKKAIGASDRSILWEFVGENIVLGVLGGIFGIIFGYLFALGISVNVFKSAALLKIWLVPVTAFVSLAATVLACLLPIRSASRIEPALVLKGE